MSERTEDGFDAYALVREEAGVFGGDDCLDNPIVLTGDIGWTAINVADAKSNAYGLPRRVAHDKPFGEDFRPLQRRRIADPQCSKGDRNGN